MRRLALAISLFAHVCAWAAFLFLLLWQAASSGESVTAVAVNSGDLPSSAPLTRVELGAPPETFSSSLISVNGIRIIPILAVPVALTATAVMASILLRGKPRLGLSLLWTSTISTVLFSLLGLLSIGLFYFPAALAMILAAVVGSLGGSQGSDAPAET
ncbi:MAG: hypothetical protein BZY79_03955 [SAR202 cluster bacterium Casp-Chloro-G4]|nr:hypothetical protein [Chloroflexota bacterium]PKB61353.1 MAG: hypothetical protein BZY79_03955 [SAR202 cluster bacterium Casp-Chloro-G4]